MTDTREQVAVRAACGEGCCWPNCKCVPKARRILAAHDAQHASAAIEAATQDVGAAIRDEHHRQVRRPGRYDYVGMAKVALSAAAPHFARALAQPAATVTPELRKRMEDAAQVACRRTRIGPNGAGIGAAFSSAVSAVLALLPPARVVVDEATVKRAIAAYLRAAGRPVHVVEEGIRAALTAALSEPAETGWSKPDANGNRFRACSVTSATGYEECTVSSAPVEFVGGLGDDPSTLNAEEAASLRWVNPPAVAIALATAAHAWREYLADADMPAAERQDALTNAALRQAEALDALAARERRVAEAAREVAQLAGMMSDPVNGALAALAAALAGDP